MKKFISVLVFLMMLVPNTCFAWVYPKTGAAVKEPTVTERINIIFDNSGHENVKEMLNNILLASAVAENADVWLYPIAGSNETVKVEPGRDFIDTYYTKYTKSSNEFKAENIVEKAFNDLKNDTAVSVKRLILYADNDTEQLRPEYRLYDWHEPYIDANPDIVFSAVMASSGNMYSNTFVHNSNYESLSGKNLYEFILVKNGYSACEAVYNSQNGVVKLEKGKVNNNIFVIADDKEIRYSNYEISEYDMYLSGCAMDTEAYQTYLKKDKVKGVALSYNHIVTDGAEKGGGTIAAALYTLDGDTVNPQVDDVYIPVVNAMNVSVYHRESRGVGICSKDTSYNSAQDKEIKNIYAPQKSEDDTEVTEKTLNKEDFLFGRSNIDTEYVSPVAKEEKGFFSKVLSFIGTLIGIILRIILHLLWIAILAFIIAIIFIRQFRSYVQLKILASRFGTTYEKFIIKIKKLIRDISSSGAKIRGTTDLNGKYIFISKASADMILPDNRITLVVRELEARGIQCWLSEKGIKPGQDYNVILPEAIKKCALFLLFVSPMSVESADVISEVGTAKEYRKTIIPVQIEPFDLFKKYTNWDYMLKQFQKTDLFASKPEEIKALADYIEQTLNETK